MFDVDHGARRCSGFGHLLDPAAVYNDFGPGIGFFFPGHEGKPGNGGNARKRFTPETEGADVIEVPIVADFAGGVSFQGQQGVIMAHAHTVVGNPDQCFPALFDLHGDPPAFGIQPIFHQLFDNRGGSFHHLPCGDFIGEDFGKDLDLGHGASQASSDCCSR